MSEVNDRLHRLHDKAIEILHGLGYDVPETTIKLNGRLSVAYGIYYTNLMEIEINKRYFLYSKDDVVINTIIHELIHAMYPECDHDGDWKRVADEVSEKTIYKIQEKGNDEDDDYLPICAKYKLVCNKCGNTEYHVSKKNHDVRVALEHRLYHARCGEETGYDVYERINNEWIKIN